MVRGADLYINYYKIKKFQTEWFFGIFFMFCLSLHLWRGLDGAMSQPRLFLYVKTGCPWCTEAMEFLNSHQLAYGKVDVRQDTAAFAKMQEVSGQTKAPVLEFGEDREILADFGADELEPFLRERGVIN